MEFGSAPAPSIGASVLAQLGEAIFTYGKVRPNMDVNEQDEEQTWKKRSIFL